MQCNELIAREEMNISRQKYDHSWKFQTLKLDLSTLEARGRSTHGDAISDKGSEIEADTHRELENSRIEYPAEVLDSLRLLPYRPETFI